VGSLRPFDDLDHAPPLRLRERARLHDPHRVTHVRVVLLVVRGKLRRATDGLAVETVTDLTVDPNEHRLVHLVRHDDAGANLPPAAFVGHLRFGHDSTSASPASAASSSSLACKASSSSSLSGTPSFSPRACASRERSSASASARASSDSSSASRWRSRSTVNSRAMSWRTTLIRDGLSSCPVADWNRRLNNSSLADSTR